MATLMEMQSARIRNTHRLSEIKEAQAGMEKLETDLKMAIDEVMKKHGLKLRNLQMSLNLQSGKSAYPSSLDSKSPSGWFNGSMDVE